MKKRLFAFIFATVIGAVLTTLPVSAQSSQAIAADIPFAFTTNGRTLPAGIYRIEPVGSDRSVWRIAGTDSRAQAFLLALNIAGSPDGIAGLTFHQYGNHRYLAGFKTSNYDVVLPASKNEKALRMKGDPFASTFVIGVGNVGGGSR